MPDLNWKFIFILAAAICFALATFAVPSPGKRFGWMPAGLFFLTLFIWP